MTSDTFSKSLNEEFINLQKSVKNPNILLLGGTGVGKSSIVNECFGKELAQTGIGRPVTETLQAYSCNGIPVVLFDTKGYEIGSSQEKEFISSVLLYAENAQSSSDPIHIAWYCISASGGRITAFDIDTIRRIIANGISTAIVITKAEMFSETESKDFIELIKNELPNIPVFETSTKFKQQKWELEELCDWSIQQLPDALKIAFAASQRKNLRIKHSEAYKAIAQHVASSIGISFTPIPISDAPLLLGNQVAMIGRILFIYNLQHLSSTLNSNLLTMVVGQMISRSGIWIVGQLLKLIPGLGTFAGGTINAAVAGSITYGIGAATVELCESYTKKVLEGNDDSFLDFMKNASSFFEEQFIKHYQINQKGNK